MEIDVSRETEEKLRRFEALLLKWNKSINLVSKDDQKDIWNRHILDSLQISNHIGRSKLWVDIGSGGGFPALILAIAASETSPQTKFFLIEKDQRKCAFLLSAAVDLGLNAEIINENVSDVFLENVEFISARAVADLNKLLFLTEGMRCRKTELIFLKGATIHGEIADAQCYWDFEYQLDQSVTNADGKIIRIWDLKRAK